MDLQALYPPSLVPTFMANLKSFYINTYNDQFFIDMPLFFKTFMWTEILYQAPVSLWAIFALLRSMFAPSSMPILHAHSQELTIQR